MSSEIAIKVENLSKCYHIYEKPRDRLAQMFFWGRKKFYREFWALKDVSFEIKKGETVGIIGRNGSGKSTLLQLICGTLAQTSGIISTQGRVAALLELGSGFNPEFTGRENVYMNASILGLSPEEIDSRYEEIVRFADIGEHINQPVKTYSSGMYVRLAFAVQAQINPDILIVDEALSVGDELFQRKCFARIDDMRKKGTTILIVSHSTASIMELCDRAVLLDRGESLICGPVKKIVGYYQKLLYAPEEKKDEIMSFVRKTQSGLLNISACDRSNVNKKMLQDASFIEADSHLSGECFDTQLVPLDTLDYESHGVDIFQPMIFNHEGKPVNVILRGHRYFYRYNVRFSVAAQAVRFGMSVRKTSGLCLGGSYSSDNTRGAIERVDSGEEISVEFSFLCNFNVGVYHMNAGVFGIQNGSEVVLNRKVDIIAFRVFPNDGDVETGSVFLDCQPIVKLMNKGSVMP